MEDKKFLTISLIVSFVLILGAVLFLSKTGDAKNGRVVDLSLLVKEGVHAKGAEGAEVTIVEFSDFQCPACKNSQADIEKVYEAYKDKIKFVYRHYPLILVHKYAKKAAEVAEFAADNGKFWEMHDLLFDKQDEWKETGDFTVYAKSLGLDDKKLLESLDQKTYEKKVDGDIEDGNRIGLAATPTFFVNGEETNGYSFEEFKRLIEKYSK